MENPHVIPDPIYIKTPEELKRRRRPYVASTANQIHRLLKVFSTVEVTFEPEHKPVMKEVSDKFRERDWTTYLTSRSLRVVHDES